MTAEIVLRQQLHLASWRLWDSVVSYNCALRRGTDDLRSTRHNSGGIKRRRHQIEWNLGTEKPANLEQLSAHRRSDYVLTDNPDQ